MHIVRCSGHIPIFFIEIYTTTYGPLSHSRYALHFTDFHETSYQQSSRKKNNNQDHDLRGWISDMGIDGPTFVPKSGYLLLILVKVCPQKLAFS